jgi:hypothetical protein
MNRENLKRHLQTLNFILGGCTLVFAIAPLIETFRLLTNPPHWQYLSSAYPYGEATGNSCHFKSQAFYIRASGGVLLLAFLIVFFSFFVKRQPFSILMPCGIIVVLLFWIYAVEHLLC